MRLQKVPYRLSPRQPTKAKAHDWMLSMLGPLFRTAGHKVRTQFCVTVTAGQRRGDVHLKICAPREVNAYRQQLTTRTSSFSPLSVPLHIICTVNFCVFFFYRPTGRPRSTAFTVIGPLATQLGQDRVLPRVLLSRTEDQSQTRSDLLRPNQWC